MMNSQHRFESKEALHYALIKRITDNLNEAITKRGSASLLVSGGSTPKPLFEKLSQVTLAWEKVTVSLVDERWVDVTSSESNEHLVRTSLLQNQAKKAHFIGLKTDHAHAGEGVAECEQRINALPLPLDIVILGMGTDGHTASFFPHTKELSAALEMQSSAKCIATQPLNAPHERMTLTRPFLLDTRNLLLHIEGEAKRSVYEEALSEGSIENMPLRAMIRQNNVILEVYHA